MEKTLEKTTEDTLNEVNVSTLNELLDSHTINGRTDYNSIDKSGEKRVVSTRMIMWTPNLAKFILKHHNNKNRAINKSNVNHILKEIDGGNWIFNGDTISFDENGQLTNGQHRLTAISERTITFNILTWTNLDPNEALKTIDTGKNRGSSDVLTLSGVKDSVTISTAVKTINDIVNNCLNSSGKGRTHSLSNTDVLDYYYILGEDRIQESINFFNGYKPSTLLLTKKLYISFHYVLTSINQEKGQEFMEKLITGIDISDGCPIKLLRDKLLKSMTTNGKKDKLTDKEKIHYVMYTWSKFVIDGYEMKMLRLPTDYVPNIDFSSVPKHK